jgi:hypothetical protein
MERLNCAIECGSVVLKQDVTAGMNLIQVK